MVIFMDFNACFEIAAYTVREDSLYLYKMRIFFWIGEVKNMQKNY